jgi:hypothetical protein
MRFITSMAASPNEASGSQNPDELKKLAKQTKMKARYLLLLDLSGDQPIPQPKLKATYDRINAGS